MKLVLGDIGVGGQRRSELGCVVFVKTEDRCVRCDEETPSLLELVAVGNNSKTERTGRFPKALGLGRRKKDRTESEAARKAAKRGGVYGSIVGGECDEVGEGVSRVKGSKVSVLNSGIVNRKSPSASCESQKNSSLLQSGNSDFTDLLVDASMG